MANNNVCDAGKYDGKHTYRLERDADGIKSINKQFKKSKETKRVTLNEQEANETEQNGGFFKYAYRYYYLLDIPPAEALNAFMCCMRTGDEDKAVKYLYYEGLENKKDIVTSYKESTVDWREELAPKFEYISERVKEMMFRRLSK